jgi:flagellin-like hook-associated protein FlgL
MPITINSSLSTPVKLSLSDSLAAASTAAIKIATGKAILHPYEDATGYNIGLKLQSSIGVLRTVVASIDQGKCMMKIAADGAKNIYDTAIKMKEILARAMSGSMTDSDIKTTLSPTYVGLKTDLGRIANSVRFGDLQLLNGQGGKQVAGTKSIIANTATNYNDNGGATTKLAAFTTTDITLQAETVTGGLSGDIIFKVATGTPAIPTVVGGTIKTNDNGDVTVSGAKLLFSSITVSDSSVSTTTLAAGSSTITSPLSPVSAGTNILTGLSATTVGGSGTTGAVTFKTGSSAVTPTIKGGTIAIDSNGNLTVTGATIKYTGITVTDSASATGNGDLTITADLTYVKGTFTVSGSSITATTAPTISPILGSKVTYTANASPGDITAVSGFSLTSTNPVLLAPISSTSQLPNTPKTAVGNLVAENVNLTFKFNEFTYADGTITSKGGKAPTVSGLTFEDLSFSITDTSGGLTEVSGFSSINTMGPFEITPGIGSSIDNLVAEYNVSGGIAAKSVFESVTGIDLSRDVVMLQMPNMSLTESKGVLGMMDTLNLTNHISKEKPKDLTDLHNIRDAEIDSRILDALLKSMLDCTNEISAYEARLINIGQQLESNIEQLDNARAVFFDADLADETENFVRENVRISVTIAALKQMSSTMQSLQQLMA